MKELGKAFSFLSSAFIYTVFFILIIVGITFGIYSFEYLFNLKEGGNTTPIFSSYIIASGSMEPNIKVYDMVVNQRVSPYELKVGDIITFFSESKMSYGLTITHRVIGITQDAEGNYYFRTKGDANNSTDDYLVPEDHIVGKAIVKVPKMGYVQKFISSVYGLMILIMVPCLLFTLGQLVKYIKKVAKKKEEPQIETVPSASV